MTGIAMNVTVDIALYPLDSDYKPAIKDFIRALRSHTGLELVTNQMSTQLRGEFSDVTAALNECMFKTMQGKSRVIFVARYLNADLDIAHAPQID